MPNILIMVAESHSLVRFVEIASDDLRSEVLAKLGQDLRASEEPGDPEPLWSCGGDPATTGLERRRLATFSSQLYDVKEKSF